MPFACSHPGCTKTFTEERNRARHEALHSGVKPHACDECTMRFVRHSDLLSHKVRHTGARPFPCTWPDCRKSFARGSDRTAHIRRHERKSGLLSPDEASDSSHAVVPTTASTERKIAQNAKSSGGVPVPFPFAQQPSHVHGVGCGHRLVVHNDHLDFLMDNGDLAHQTDNGDWLLHILDDVSSAPQRSHSPFWLLQPPASVSDALEAQLCVKSSSHPHPHVHHEHAHGPECGHVKVLHDGHVDYLVDGQLHSTHNGHCDFHGFLNSFDNGPDGAHRGAMSDFLGLFEHKLDGCCG